MDRARRFVALSLVFAAHHIGGVLMRTAAAIVPKPKEHPRVVLLVARSSYTPRGYRHDVDSKDLN